MMHGASLTGRGLVLLAVLAMALGIGMAACDGGEEDVVQVVEAVTGEQLPTAAPPAPTAEVPDEPTATPTPELEATEVPLPPAVEIVPLPNECATAGTLELPETADPEIVSSLALVGGGGGDWDGVLCDPVGSDPFPEVAASVDRALQTSSQADYDAAVDSIEEGLGALESGTADVGGGEFGSSRAAMGLNGRAAELGDAETLEKAEGVAKDVFAEEAGEQLDGAGEFALSDIEMFLDIAADAQRWGDEETADRALDKAREIYEELVGAAPAATAADPCQFDLELVRETLELVELGQRLGATEAAIEGAREKARQATRMVATAAGGGADVGLNTGELNQIEGSLDLDLSDDESGDGCSSEWVLTSVLDASLGILFVGASGTLTTEVALTVDDEGVVSGTGSQSGIVQASISVPGQSCSITTDYAGIVVEVSGTRILSGEEIALKLKIHNLGGTAAVVSDCPDTGSSESVMATTTPITIDARDGATSGFNFMGIAEITYDLALP